MKKKKLWKKKIKHEFRVAVVSLQTQKTNYWKKNKEMLLIKCGIKEKPRKTIANEKKY